MHLCIMSLGDAACWGMCSPWSFTLHVCSMFMAWLVACSLTTDQARCLSIMTHQCQSLKHLQSLLGLSPSCQRVRFWQRLSRLTGERRSLLETHAEHCSKTMAKCSLRQAPQQEGAFEFNAQATCLSNMPEQYLNVLLLC